MYRIVPSALRTTIRVLHDSYVRRSRIDSARQIRGSSPTNWSGEA